HRAAKPTTRRYGVDYHLAVIAGALRRASDDLDRRYARTPRMLDILHTGIAAAYRGLSDEWGTEIPAGFLPGFLAEDYADAQAAREALAEIEAGAEPVPWEQVKAELDADLPASRRHEPGAL
ncbi:MAG TPA: hypothetical protein VF070_19695, partial [Streptosporangiaceae bacterium]